MYLKQASIRLGRHLIRSLLLVVSTAAASTDIALAASYTNTWTLLCFGSKDVSACPVANSPESRLEQPTTTDNSGRYQYGQFGTDNYTVVNYDSRSSTSLGSLHAESTLSVGAGRVLSPVAYLETYSYFNEP